MAAAGARQSRGGGLEALELGQVWFFALRVFVVLWATQQSGGARTPALVGGRARRPRCSRRCTAARRRGAGKPPPACRGGGARGRAHRTAQGWGAAGAPGKRGCTAAHALRGRRTFTTTRGAARARGRAPRRAPAPRGSQSHRGAHRAGGPLPGLSQSLRPPKGLGALGGALPRS
jgi:hypothetical protein